MTATGHAVVGVALAAAVPNPVLGIPLAIVSHVLCDLIPHWDAGTHIKKKSRGQFTIEAIIDITLSFLLAYILLVFVFPQTSVLYGFLMVFMAQLIDWLTGPYVILGWKFPPFTWIYALQHATNSRLDKPWGIVTQASVVGIMVILAKLL